MEGKSIASLVSPMKQLKILKKDQQVFSALQFEALPKEVILHVFSYLKIVDLLNCGQVSKRFRAISRNDQYLWPKALNLCYKNVPVVFIQKLLDSGCKYLTLSYSVLDGTLNLSKASKLKYLDISSFGLKNGTNSIKLLESCYSLQKLSLKRFQLSSKLISITCLQNGKTLKVLDLSKCNFAGKHYLEDSSLWELDCIKKIVKNCTELKELSLNMTKLCKKSIDFLVSNLTTKIEKLDLFYHFPLRDEHIKTLVKRCNKITELNLGGATSLTKQSLSFIIEHLKLTLVKLNFKFTNVRFDLSDLYQLKTMKKLKLLYYDNKEARKIINHRRLKKMMPNLKINSGSGNSRIAGPCQPEYNYRNWVIKAEGEQQGFWEINAERETLFTDYFSSRYLQMQYSKE